MNKETYSKMREVATKEEVERRFGVRVVDELPEGWRVTSGTTQPRGYVWVCNGKSMFGGEYQHALMRVCGSAGEGGGRRRS